MIYLFCKAEEAEVNNQWVRDNCDPSAEDTFVPNKIDSDGNEFCLISLPDNDSLYNQKMIAQFGSYNKDPREESVEVKEEPIMIKGKLKEVSTMVQLDDIEEVQEVEKVEYKPIRQWN